MRSLVAVIVGVYSLAHADPIEGRRRGTTSVAIDDDAIVFSRKVDGNLDLFLTERTCK